LADFLHTDANGILFIDEDELEKLEKELTADFISAQNAAIVAQ
jgi:hypothetical protein